MLTTPTKPTTQPQIQCPLDVKVALLSLTDTMSRLLNALAILHLLNASVRKLCLQHIKTPVIAFTDCGLHRDDCEKMAVYGHCAEETFRKECPTFCLVACASNCQDLSTHCDVFIEKGLCNTSFTAVCQLSCGLCGISTEGKSFLPIHV